MFFSFDNSGNLVTSPAAVDGVLCFGLDSLPSDWYSRLSKDYDDKSHAPISELTVGEDAVDSPEVVTEDPTATDTTAKPKRSKAS